MPRKRRNKKSSAYSKKTAQTAPNFSSLASVPRKVLLKRFSYPKNWDDAGFERITLKKKRHLRQRGGARRVPGDSGFFQSLPIELFHMILYKLDCRSLARLAATNSALETFIKNQDYYSLVVENCLNIVRCAPKLHSLSCPPWSPLTAKQIYDAFKDPQCVGCGMLGPYLFIPSCFRCCSDCVGREPRVSALFFRDACKQFKLQYKDLFGSPLCYNFNTAVVNLDRSQLHITRENGSDLMTQSVSITPYNALKFARQHHGPEHWQTLPANMARYYQKFEHLQDWNLVMPFAFIDPESKRADFGRLCSACIYAADKIGDNRLRKVNSEVYSDSESDFESSDTENENPDGPTGKQRRCLRRRAMRAIIKYSSSTLLTHLRSGECRYAARLWRAEWEMSGVS